MELKKEKSCGCIIVNDNKTLLIFEKHRNFWGFPKGHMEAGETEVETAKREVKEEVGIDVEVDASKRYELNYVIENLGIDKTTILYLAKPKTFDVKMQESEIENAKWCDFNEALNEITYDNWRDVFKKAIAEI